MSPRDLGGKGSDEGGSLRPSLGPRNETEEGEEERVTVGPFPVGLTVGPPRVVLGLDE